MHLAKSGQLCADRLCPKIRMFVEPGSPDYKPTINADPTAAARSSIRRQRTVRYSPNVRDNQSTLNSAISRDRSRTQGRMRILADRRSLLEDIRRRNHRTTSSTFRPNDIQDIEADTINTHSEADQRISPASGRAFLRDALAHEPPARRMRIARENTSTGSRGTRGRGQPFIPNDLRNLRALSRSEGTRSPPPEYIVLPPDATSRNFSSRSSPLGTASLTPGFAPAHGLELPGDARPDYGREEILARLSARMGEMTDAGERDHLAGHRAEINRMRSRDPTELTPDYLEAEAAYLDSVETRLDLMRPMRERDLSELPPLHRMSRPFQDIPRATHNRAQGDLDGLGDRQRSFSPDDDHWETILTTIQPDERIPSVHSSFTSATASSSSFSSNSGSSSGTLLTAPSTDADNEACPVDLNDSEGDEIDIMDAQLSQAESQARRIESLSARLSRQQNHNERHARQRRNLEREEELQRIEVNLRRLERQMVDEHLTTAGRHRLDGSHTGRERI